MSNRIPKEKTFCRSNDKSFSKIWRFRISVEICILMLKLIFHNHEFFLKIHLHPFSVFFFFFCNSLFVSIAGHRPPLEFFNLFDLESTGDKIFQLQLQCHLATFCWSFFPSFTWYTILLVHRSSSCRATCPSQDHFK